MSTTCAHKHAWPISVLYHCRLSGMSAKAKCEQHCSNWATCIGYMIRFPDSEYPQCQLFPSQPGSCPSSQWTLSRSDLPIARNKNDLKPDEYDPGYCKYKHGMNWQDILELHIRFKISMQFKRLSFLLPIVVF